MNYHNISYPDMNNGSGLRVGLWLSGCDHHCHNCQNPQTWNPDNGILFDEAAKEELFRELSKDYISGLTLSGGDPLYKENLDEVLRLVKRVRKQFPDKTIWIYSGYTWEECQPLKDCSILHPEEYAPNLQIILKKRFEIISMCNVFVDGEYIDSLRDVTLKWCGSSNQRVIDIQKSLNKGEIVLCD